VGLAATVAIGGHRFDDSGDAAAACEPRLDVGSHPAQAIGPQLQRLGKMSRAAPSPQRGRRDTKLRQDFRARQKVKGRCTHAPAPNTVHVRSRTGRRIVRCHELTRERPFLVTPRERSAIGRYPLLLSIAPCGRSYGSRPVALAWPRSQEVARSWPAVSASLRKIGAGRAWPIRPL